jgi:hypothetical protein
LTLPNQLRRLIGQQYRLNQRWCLQIRLHQHQTVRRCQLDSSCPLRLPDRRQRLQQNQKSSHLTRQNRPSTIRQNLPCRMPQRLCLQIQLDLRLPDRRFRQNNSRQQHQTNQR